MTGQILLLGKGFIGTQLGRALRKQGYSVQSYASSDCDLRDPDCVTETLGPLDEEDTLILSAARTRHSHGQGGLYTDNVAIARSVAQFLQRHPIKQVIFFSTADVYGPSVDSQSLHEELSLNPVGAYARSKAVSESILQYVCSPYSTRLMVLRFPGVYGPGDHNKSVISRMLKDAQQDGVITVKGCGQLRRDYLFVDDLIGVVQHTLEAPRHATVNVATGRSHSIQEIAQMIAQELDSGIEVRQLASKFDARSFDLSFDVRRLRAMFPSVSWTSVPEGIRQLCKSR